MSSSTSSHRSDRPTIAQRIPLWTANSLLPLLAVAVVWSASPHLLTWRHSQLLAGAIGGLTLLLLRILPVNARGTAAGRTPMAVTMFAVAGMTLLAVMTGHPQLWNGAMVVLMLSGVTAWLWYPPAFFSPFPAAAQAAIALSVAVIVSISLEYFGISPLHYALDSEAKHTFIRGAFDQSQTLSTVLFVSALSLIVAAWPNPSVPPRTRRFSQAMLALTCATGLLIATPIPFSARVAIGLVALVGMFWRPQRAQAENALEAQRTDTRYRWGAITAVLSVVLIFTLPPLLAQDSPYSEAPSSGPTSTVALDPTWHTTDPLPKALDTALRKAEWRAAIRNLPFGAGVGTSLDEALRYLQPVDGLRNHDEPVTQFGWPDTPRSMLATMITEHGIMALFVWVLITAGGLLLARLVIVHSVFPPAIAQVIGITPGVTLAFLPGGSQMATALAMVLSWFLLCAPLAHAEARSAARLVPAPSTPADHRRAPRGRIIILLVPAVFIAWFAVANLRWSSSAYWGYRANLDGAPDQALEHFHEANRAFAHAQTLYNEARLMERETPGATEPIETLYAQAKTLRPRSPSYRVAHAQWLLRRHALTARDAQDSAALQALVERAHDDVQEARREAPRWALAHALQLETLILLDRLDDADALYDDLMQTTENEEARNALRLLRIRMLAWKRDDLVAARALLDEALEQPASPTTRDQLTEERALLEMWEATGESPYTLQTFHAGHAH